MPHIWQQAPTKWNGQEMDAKGVTFDLLDLWVLTKLLLCFFWKQNSFIWAHFGPAFGVFLREIEGSANKQVCCIQKIRTKKWLSHLQL